ncbi:MAG: hypothetical protein WBB32_04035 [Flavobacteriales bacterium]
MFHPTRWPFNHLLPLLILLIACPLNSHAQKAHPRDHGSTTLEKGFELEDQEKYDEALALYATVHRSDSIYARVLLRKVAMQFNLKHYDALLPMCDEGIALNGELTSSFLLFKGATLVELKRYAEGIAAYDSTIRIFPGLYQPRKLRALALYEKDDQAGYLAALKENAILFPMSPSNHVSLASVALQEGCISQAALSIFMALMVRWGDTESRDALSDANRLLDGKLDSSPKGTDVSSGDDFKELDLLLRNRVAMNKGYKVKPDLSYAFVRQGYFLLNNLKDHPAGDGFWTTYYVPFMKELVDDDLFEAFVYHALSNSNDAKVQALVSKRKAEVEKFRSSIYPLLKQFYLTFPDSVGNEFIPVDHYYYSSGDLRNRGAGGSMDTPIGPWVEFGTNGRISSRGTFTEDHKRTGIWEEYHPNGVLKRRQVWNNGVENGPYFTWNTNGTLNDSANVVDGKVQGPYAQYSEMGALIARKTFTDSELTGPARTYYPCGTLTYADVLTNNLTNGFVTVLYPDGKKKFTAEYKDDKRVGNSIEYGRNGQPLSDLMNADGKRNGPFTEWYPNGQKRAEGTYTADNLTGVRTLWSENGLLSEEEFRDPQGRASGLWTSYSPQGPKQAEMEYNRDLLIRYRYFDLSGKLLGEGKRAKGRFEFTGYSPYGNKRMEGSYLAEGAKDGAWTWWYPDGTVRTEEDLKAGKLEGVQRNFTTSGKLRNEKSFLPGMTNTGPYTQYYADGSVEDLGWLDSDQLDGEQWRFLPDGKVIEHEYYAGGWREGWQRYFDRDGILRADERYKDGDLVERINYDSQGNSYEHIVLKPGVFLWEEHFPNGKLKVSKPYLNGVIHGTLKEFYPDGSKRGETAYFNGKIHGSVKYWHPNGQPSYEGAYDLGDRTGTDKRWNNSGTLVRTGSYENGRSTGFTIFHSNGKPALERPARFGEDHGAVRSYSTGGDLQLVRYYTDGRLIGYSYNGPDGTLVDTIPLGEGVVHLASKYPNGKPSREMTYRNDQIEGAYKEYHPNGQLMEECTFDAGDRIGTDRNFSAEGTPQSTTLWANGAQHGEQLEYWPNGNLLQKSNYVHGLRHGLTVDYDKTGKAILELTYRDDDVVAMKKLQ